MCKAFNHKKNKALSSFQSYSNHVMIFTNRKRLSRPMEIKTILKPNLFVFLAVGFSYLSTGCDTFFQDPRQILYRPVTLKIEDFSGKVFSKLPIPVHPQFTLKTGELTQFPEGDSLWGKDPGQAEVAELFSEEEIPYLGGDNCLNSVFFDVIGIPYSKDSAPVYQSKAFLGNIQGFVKETSNFFFYHNHLFLKESTYPYLSQQNHELMVGNKISKEGANQAIEQFYGTRLNDYKTIFKEKIRSFKISCQYQAQTMGTVKEDIVLHMMESDKSLIFLASKEIHITTRKDRLLRYVSDFMLSKEFFQTDLQFSPN